MQNGTNLAKTRKVLWYSLWRWILLISVCCNEWYDLPGFTEFFNILRLTSSFLVRQKCTGPFFHCLHTWLGFTVKSPDFNLQCEPRRCLRQTGVQKAAASNTHQTASFNITQILHWVFHIKKPGSEVLCVCDWIRCDERSWIVTSLIWADDARFWFVQSWAPVPASSRRR